MERYEMAELLSKKAGVTLEEARAVLAENEWDMLDAMVALERRSHAAVSTVVVDAGSKAEGEPQPQPVKTPKKEPIFTNGFAEIWHYIKRLCLLSVKTDFTVIRREKNVFSVPVLVMVILLVACFWVTLPILVIGLFVGCKYRFEGHMPGGQTVNKAMEKLENAVENVKDSLDGKE